MTIALTPEPLTPDPASSGSSATPTAVRAPARRRQLIDIPAEAMATGRQVLLALGAANRVLHEVAIAPVDPELASTPGATLDRLVYVRGGVVHESGFADHYSNEERAHAARILEIACMAQSAPVIAALDVLVRRARDPFESLITFPPEVLLEPEVAAAVRHRRLELGPVDTSVGSVRFGADADYAGTRTAIIKLTRLCNLRCVYCNDWSASPNTTMDQATRLVAFERILGDANRGDADAPHTVTVVWHGGEPTTIGRREVLATLWLERSVSRPGQRLSNVLQTNATRVDDAWADFFARYNFVVGVSLDGPKHIHDTTRPGLGGRPTFDRAVAGISKLQERGVFRGALVVVTHELAALGGRGIVDFLRSAGITKCALLPVRPQVGEAEPYLDLGSWTELLIEVDRARTDGGPALGVRELDAIQATLDAKPAGWCELQGNCQGAIVNVEADGSIGHCDKYVGDPRFKIGNLHEPEWIDPAIIESLKQSDAPGRAATEPCRWSEHCRGGCPHEREVLSASGRPLPQDCCGLGPVYDHLAASAAGASVAVEQ